VTAANQLVGGGAGGRCATAAASFDDRAEVLVCRSLARLLWQACKPCFGDLWLVPAPREYVRGGVRCTGLCAVIFGLVLVVSREARIDDTHAVL
jgi:hypothetical protein